MQTDDEKAELDALRALSARIGADASLTQAAGGNTSLKAGDVLWIKASGAWLAHALDQDIMVPVSMPPLLDAVSRSDASAEQPQQFTIAANNPSGLRPSIETTVHALMPQRIVVHVHCVDTIALAVRSDCQGAITPMLHGLNWTLVPYRRPGLPLARAIAERLQSRPDVLVLANHGLVVAADTIAAADALLADVKDRLRQPVRQAVEADVEALRQLAKAANFRLPADPEAHAVATDPISMRIAAKGSLYPDHVIFLGVGSVVAQQDEDVAAVVARVGSAPLSILVPGKGVLMRGDASRAADAMARCLADVTARIPDGAPVRCLTAEDNLQLTDWDAEKYRQRLDAKAGIAAVKNVA